MRTSICCLELGKHDGHCHNHFCDHKKTQSFSILAFHVGRHSRFAAELVPHPEVEINREATGLPL